MYFAKFDTFFIVEEQVLDDFVLISTNSPVAKKWVMFNLSGLNYFRHLPSFLP